MSATPKPKWWIFKGDKTEHDGIATLPKPPEWRQFTATAAALRGAVFEPEDHEVELVNAAIYLRRPLLITGRAGIGKTTLAYAVAHELKLGKVLRWSVTTQSTLKDALYRYDPVGRLQETSLRDRGADAAPGSDKKPPPIEKFLRLGPLGAAFADSISRPRVLLIDEIDKSDIDLPNDLLHIFEEGEFEIPELSRLSDERESVPILLHEPEKDDPPISITRGKVHCRQFPIVIMTSNGEREFPPAFLRRCLRLEMDWPMDAEKKKDKLARIVRAHLQEEYAPEHEARISQLLDTFVKRLEEGQAELATDQLLNAIYLVLKGVNPQQHYDNRDQLLESLWKSLGQ